MVNWLWVPFVLFMGVIAGFVLARVNDKKLDQIQADVTAILKK